jgi:predicted  nucleic acid-binding Zn-ribbon protein
VADLSREQRKADADVEQVKARHTRNEQRIIAGLVGDPKQLQAMQHENESLVRRIGDLEDVELEVMERLESAQSELDRLGLELAELDEGIVEATKARDEAATEVARQQTDALADRERLVTQIPGNLLALYDRLRDQMGGVAVGALQHGRCGGCRLEVGARELSRIAAAPDDEVFRCEECDRILVRAPTSEV